MERDDTVIDAVGPERPAILGPGAASSATPSGAAARIVHVPGAVMPVLSSALGLVLRDVLLST